MMYTMPKNLLSICVNFALATQLPTFSTFVLLCSTPILPLHISKNEPEKRLTPNRFAAKQSRSTDSTSCAPGVRRTIS